MREFQAYGLTIGSEFSLPFVRSCGDPSFLVQQGDVRPTASMVPDGPVSYDLTAEEWRLEYHGEAAYGLTETSIRVAPSGTPAPEAIAYRLAGPLLGLCLRRQGALVLHANVVERGGTAIALMGSTGAGKTTLSRALVDSGCRLMSDDLGVFRHDGNGWRAFGGTGRLKVRQGSGKQLVRAPSFSGSAPLRAVFVVRPGRVAVRRHPHTQALLELVRHAHMPRSLDQTGLAASHFEESGRLMNAVPCLDLCRGTTRADVPQTVETILEHWT